MIIKAIKLKTLLLSVLAVFLCGYIVSQKAATVFKVGNREIPIYSVERDDNRIALTFNCAWSDGDIDRIIETLKKHNADATFFIVGEWAEKYPDSLRKLFDAGFEIGNHSYNHAHYNKMSKADILKDMEKGDSAIENVIGKKPYLFRAAYGEYNNDTVTACDESGRMYIQWSLDSIDYKAGSPDDILNRLLPHTKSGDIILLHSGTEHTADALDTLLSELSKKYTFSNISDMVYKENYKIDGTGRQYNYAK